MRLDGEVALVTGATSGIGRVIAETLAAAGAGVAVAGRDAERGAEVVRAITATGGRARFVHGDLTSADDRVELVGRAAGELGPVTVLVNSAVVATTGLDGPVTAVTPEAWTEILTGNLIAVADLCREVIPGMIRAGGGSIVNISSRAAARGTPGRAAYSASKGALEALTSSIAVDHAADRIRCNVVRPGFVRNERRDGVLSAERREALEAAQLTRVTEPDDVAGAVLYLVSPAAGAVTGTVLPVDGGSTTVRARVVG